MEEKTLTADYYQDFSCIGGSCGDNCCIGWQVELDRKTYNAYQKIQEKELKELVRCYVYRNEEEWDPVIDYGLIELLPNRRCPFLNPHNLCAIQLKKGEAFLSNVCAGYPRMINRVEGVLEYSLTLSCPEAARRVLDRKEPLSWISGEAKLESRQILNVDYRASHYSGQFLGENLVILRDKTISILQNREYSMSRRIWMLGDFLEDSKTQQAPSKLGLSQRDKFIFWEGINKRFNTIENLDSPRYLAMMKPTDNPMDFSEFPFELEFILENYLVNYVFQSLFPAGESQNPQDAFFKLGIRYALVKYGGMKVASSGHKLSRDDVINLIQCFSKATEHHYTYFDDILKYLKKRVKDPNRIRSLIQL